MRASRWLLITGCVALLVGSFFLSRKVLNRREIASTQQVRPVPSGAAATRAVEPNDEAALNAVDPQASKINRCRPFVVKQKRIAREHYSLASLTMPLSLSVFTHWRSYQTSFARRVGRKF